MTEQPDGQMNEGEFLRARFFSTEAEVAALKAQGEAIRETRRAKRRQRWEETRQFRVMKSLTRCFATLDQKDIAAWVHWLASRYHVEGME